ncbi:MAG: YqeG family HAD IIIA-type phosphatase [Fimbriimonadales bacterium]
MSAFRTGRYNPDRLPRMLRGLCPTAAVDSVLCIDPCSLAERGKRLLLLDVDNTLLAWRGREVPSDVAAWVRAVLAKGLDVCVVSNTKRPRRLRALCSALGIPFVRDRFKPSRRMFLLAMERYGAGPEETIMVGDQLFTDVLGARRAGIEAVWVRPVGEREFVGTKLSRLGERILRHWLDRALEDER